MKRLSVTLFSVLLLFVSLAIPAKAATSRQAGQVSVSYGSLNVRAQASSDAAVRTRLAKGSYVTLLEKTGSWWRVAYGDGAYGYCHADYITPVSSDDAEVRVSYGSLNVRSGPGTSYGKIASLYNGNSVLVLSRSGSWSRILYHGTKTGWVSSTYLSSGSGAVSLNVPKYLQTDSRWANKTLGSSGYTMKRSGCATTGIAMMESYRTGTTIYPDAMAAQLRYTASGNVYWPGHYTVDTSASGYLSKILTLLRAGKPALFGATNRYGSQHWVVITGFTGGEVIPANFTINDPGTASRTTLAHFLAAYPNFYKYFSY